MAKPLSVASTHGIGVPAQVASSSTSSTPTQSSRRRRRATTGSKARLLSPSSTLLSLLAGLASSNTVEGSAAPPKFLCPSLDVQEKPARTRGTKRRRSTEANRDVASTTQSDTPKVVLNALPHRFQPGEDGYWTRNTEGYYFYGRCTGTCTDSTILDGQISQPNDTNNPDTPMQDTAVLENLPPGWKPTPKSFNSKHTTLILVLSLVLAFAICFLIIGFLFWRKAMRRKYKDRDPEKRGKRQKDKRNRSASLRAEEEREVNAERESKAKQRIWARATARWKANARSTARQRRGKRLAQSLRERQSTGSLDSESRDTRGSRASTPSISPSHSPSCSRRSSISTFHQDATVTSMDVTSTPVVAGAPAIPAIAVSPPEPSSSPPAYQQKNDTSGASSSERAAFDPDNCTLASSLVRPRRLSDSCDVSARSDLDLGEETSSVCTGPSAGHVATDDKSVLARMAELASEPPSSQSGSELEVSAPEWRDEEMEEFVALQSAASSDTSTTTATGSPSSPSPFPPPPCKSQLLVPNFYDYPYSFEEMTSPEAEYEPSAPPFEETPSAPPVDETGTGERTPQASAPPLMDHDDFYLPESPSPNAATQDPVQPNTNTACDGNHTSQESRTLASELEGEVAVAEAHDSPSSSLSGHDRRGSGGTLPVYRP